MSKISSILVNKFHTVFTVPSLKRNLNQILENSKFPAKFLYVNDIFHNSEHKLEVKYERHANLDSHINLFVTAYYRPTHTHTAV